MDTLLTVDSQLLYITAGLLVLTVFIGLISRIAARPAPSEPWEMAESSSVYKQNVFYPLSETKSGKSEEPSFIDLHNDSGVGSYTDKYGCTTELYRNGSPLLMDSWDIRSNS